MARKKNYQYSEDENDLADFERPSRSQKKRDSTALQKIGEEIVALPLSKARKLPLTTELIEALELMSRISDKEGRRRQMQYIGKLMRECNIDELRPALDALRQGHSQNTAIFHHAEKLREALLVADNAEQLRLISQWSEEIQMEILELLNGAKKENSTGAKRALFRKLHEVLSAGS